MKMLIGIGPDDLYCAMRRWISAVVRPTSTSSHPLFQFQQCPHRSLPDHDGPDRSIATIGASLCPLAPLWYANQWRTKDAKNDLPAEMTEPKFHPRVLCKNTGMNRAISRGRVVVDRHVVDTSPRTVHDGNWRERACPRARGTGAICDLPLASTFAPAAAAMMDGSIEAPAGSTCMSGSSISPNLAFNVT